MRIANISYVHFKHYSDPQQWIKESAFFKKIWIEMANHHEVFFYEFLNYTGKMQQDNISFSFSKANKIALKIPFFTNRNIAKLNPDLVFVNGLSTPLQVILLRIMLGKNVKIVVQHHAEQPFKNTLKKAVQRLADRCVDAYLFTSFQLAKPWLDEAVIHDNRKIREVMEVSSIFYPMEKKEARRITMVKGQNTYLWVGHLNENKNPLLLVQAMIYFLNNNSSCSLYMIFQSNALLSEIEVLLTKHKEAGKCIHLVGKVKHDDLLHWYNSVDFIISTSYYEAAGVSVCEAMSCGCIPILSKIPSFIFMTNNKCGILYDTGNQQSLERALNESLFIDKEKQKEATIVAYAQRLSPQAIAASIDKVIYTL